MTRSDLLETYRDELAKELEDILAYWMRYTPDPVNGGFVGRIDHANTIYPEAPKGAVLNSRILWSFSSAYLLTKKEEYLKNADRAYDYLVRYFLDKEFGGVFWTVDHKGVALDTKKQVYALAFAVYGLSKYSQASGNKEARAHAVALYEDIVKHSYDEVYGGYIEALSRDWKEIGDLRLSGKDANERKSMNTHLHLLESFTSLYQVWPDKALAGRIRELVKIFLEHIIDSASHHLVLFFDDAWTRKSQIISYGHDIEAAWLVEEAAALLNDPRLLLQVKEYSVLTAKAVIAGLDDDGGLWYEYDPAKDHLVMQKHSWPQAEAMVGFFNVWQITADEKWLRRSINSWQFIRQYINDRQGGEWVWGVNGDYSLMANEDKVGIWKCPYHNSRACMEIIKRINSL